MTLNSAYSAFAASGWYLFVPPRSHFVDGAAYAQGYKTLDTKPLSQWWQQSAYDSASECESVKNTLLMTERSIFYKLNESYSKAVGAKKDSDV